MSVFGHKTFTFSWIKILLLRLSGGVNLETHILGLGGHLADIFGIWTTCSQLGPCLDVESGMPLPALPMWQYTDNVQGLHHALLSRGRTSLGTRKTWCGKTFPYRAKWIPSTGDTDQSLEKCVLPVIKVEFHEWIFTSVISDPRKTFPSGLSSLRSEHEHGRV